MMWSKLKALLHKGEARNHPEFLKAISTVTPQDALGRFAHLAATVLFKTSLEGCAGFFGCGGFGCIPFFVFFDRDDPDFGLHVVVAGAAELAAGEF